MPYRGIPMQDFLQFMQFKMTASIFNVKIDIVVILQVTALMQKLVIHSENDSP